MAPRLTAWRLASSPGLRRAWLELPSQLRRPTCPRGPGGHASCGPLASAGSTAPLEEPLAAEAPALAVGEAPTATAAVQPDGYYMHLALLEAHKAAALGEVPVGAVLVSTSGQVLAAAHNRVESSGDPTAHAEMACLRAGAAAAGGWRLLGTTLYVTLEPCPMCAGALLQARVGRLVYGARNRLLGADGSWIALLPQQAQQQEQAQQEAEAAQRSEQPQPQGPAVGAEAPTSKEGQQEEERDLPGSSASATCSCGAEGSAAAGAAPRHPFHPALHVVRGVLEAECSEAMRAFFRRRRQERGGSGSGSGSSSGDEAWL